MELTRSELDPPPEGTESQSGTVLDGKYQIIAEIGSGGMGVVYEGRNVAIGRRVAIKMLHQCYAGHAEAVERFELEARAAAPIAHPSIVDVLDMGRSDKGVPYIVMEHLEGQGLYQRLVGTGPLAPGRAVSIVIQVLGGLSAAHAVGIVHRDVKPENIFLVRRGEGDEVVKILDFGVAAFSPPRRTTAGRLTAAGIVVGTPGYMSPEQSQGGDVDARSDLYSVGVLLYELLTGKLPRGPEGRSLAVPILQLLPGLPAELAAVIGKAHHRIPDSRFQTATDFLEALRPFERLSGQAPSMPTMPMGLAAMGSQRAFADGAFPEGDAAGPASGARAIVHEQTPEAVSARGTIRRRAPALSGWLGLVLTAAVTIAATLVYRHFNDAPLVDRGPRVVLPDGPAQPANAGALPASVLPASVNVVQASAGGGADQAPHLYDGPPEVDSVPDPAPAIQEAPVPPRVLRTKPVLPFSNVY